MYGMRGRRGKAKNCSNELLAVGKEAINPRRTNPQGRRIKKKKKKGQ